jgi:hypothetical protein
MGAETKFRVKVLRLVEDFVDAYGVVASDAEAEAAKMPGVARVIEVRGHWEEQFEEAE